MTIDLKKITVATALLTIGLVAGCKKSGLSSNSTGGGGSKLPSTDSVYNPADPSLAASIGFFANGWQPRTFITPNVVAGSPATAAPTDSLFIDLNRVLVKVPPYIFGINSNLWTGQTVTQPALMQYLSDLSPNVIRGPGGSISDVYFWNGTDANPAPSDAPSTLLNASGTPGAAGYWYGGN